MAQQVLIYNSKNGSYKGTIMTEKCNYKQSVVIGKMIRPYSLFLYGNIGD